MKSPLLNFQGHSCFQTPKSYLEHHPGPLPLNDHSSGFQAGALGGSWARGTHGWHLTPAPGLAPRASTLSLGFAPSRAPVGEITVSAPVTPLRACDTHSCRVSLLCACFAGARFHPGDKPQPCGWLSGRFLAPGSQGKAGMTHTSLGRGVCSGAGLNGCDCLAELLSEVLLSICTLTSNV